MRSEELYQPELTETDIGFDKLIYVRVTEACNLHCEHCFIPANPKKMTLDQISTIPKKLSTITSENDRIMIQWHGGEPTAMGATWFNTALNTIKYGSNGKIINSLQTNLMNYSEKWRDIFIKHFDSKIGVSWDPEIRLMKRGDKASNTEYEEKFWLNLEQLINDGIRPTLVITGTKIFFERFKNPNNLFNFLESKGIEEIHIERLTKTGYAKDSWDTIGVSNKEWSNYMSRLYRGYEIYKKRPRPGKQPLNISPLDGLNESVGRLINGESGGYGCLSGSCDTGFHTFDANGYKSGCTALNSEVDNSKSDGVQVIRILDLEKERVTRQLDCMSCKFKPICSSGCFATPRLDDSGECSGGYTLFNNIYQIKTV